MITIKPLKEISTGSLYTAWEDAFSDYAVHISIPELERMLRRRGYDAALSFGAFAGDRLVSFTLNGTGIYNGQKTAYDTGTGTIKEYRSKGLVKKTFLESLPFLQSAGITQYLLEVLQVNATAISIYTAVGFKVSREFIYFITTADKLQLDNRPLPPQYHLQETDFDRINEMMAMWDFTPSWQNSFDSINRCPADFKIIAAYENTLLVGYGIIEPATGDITQIAVHPQHRNYGIATNVLRSLLEYNKAGKLKVINADTRCTALTSFLEKNGIPRSGMQFEMIKDIIPFYNSPVP